MSDDSVRNARIYLREQIAGLEVQASRERAALLERQSKLTSLEQTISVLNQVLRKLYEPGGGADSDLVEFRKNFEASERDVVSEKLGPVNAIRSILMRNPKGMQIKDIVQSLVGNMDTESNDERRVIYATVHHMRKRDELVELEDGTVRLKPK